jgi:hypothetical protein
MIFMLVLLFEMDIIEMLANRTFFDISNTVAVVEIKFILLELFLTVCAF